MLCFTCAWLKILCSPKWISDWSLLYCVGIRHLLYKNTAAIVKTAIQSNGTALYEFLCRGYSKWVLHFRYSKIISASQYGSRGFNCLELKADCYLGVVHIWFGQFGSQSCDCREFELIWEAKIDTTSSNIQNRITCSLCWDLGVSSCPHNFEIYLGKWNCNFVYMLVICLRVWSEVKARQGS